MQNSAYCTSFILKTKFIWFSYGNWYFITYSFLILCLIEKPGSKITSENNYLLLYSLTSTLYKCLSTAFSSDELKLQVTTCCTSSCHYIAAQWFVLCVWCVCVCACVKMMYSMARKRHKQFCSGQFSLLCSGYFSTRLFTLTRSIMFWVFTSQGCFVTWIMCAAYTHCLNLKRWCLIYPQIDNIFKAAHHTHCHLEWGASLLFPWELLLISTYWRGLCCHDNSTDEYVNS